MIKRSTVSGINRDKNMVDPTTGNATRDPDERRKDWKLTKPLR